MDGPQPINHRHADFQSAAVLNPAHIGSAGEVTAGHLRESILHRYAQCCNFIRERLLIDQ